VSLYQKSKLDKFLAQGKRCFYCGCHMSLKKHAKKYATRDHFIPVSKGGSQDTNNIVLCCNLCNMQKASKMPLGFLTQKIKRQIEKREEKARDAGTNHT